MTFIPTPTQGYCLELLENNPDKWFSTHDFFIEICSHSKAFSNNFEPHINRLNESLLSLCLNNKDKIKRRQIDTWPLQFEYLYSSK